jgi:hypothetical protein
VATDLGLSAADSGSLTPSACPTHLPPSPSFVTPLLKPSACLRLLAINPTSNFPDLYSFAPVIAPAGAYKPPMSTLLSDNCSPGNRPREAPPTPEGEREQEPRASSLVHRHRGGSPSFSPVTCEPLWSSPCERALTRSHSAIMGQSPAWSFGVPGLLFKRSSQHATLQPRPPVTSPEHLFQSLSHPEVSQPEKERAGLTPSSPPRLE